MRSTQEVVTVCTPRSIRSTVKTLKFCSWLFKISFLYPLTTSYLCIMCIDPIRSQPSPPTASEFSVPNMSTFMSHTPISAYQRTYISLAWPHLLKVISLLLLLLWGPRLQHRNLWGTDYKPQQQWVRICLPVNAQSTMKPWIIVLTVSAHGILVFLHVLGSLKDDLEEIDQCWVQPPTRFCGKRCTKVRKCVSPNYTCCWTYCGNICLNNEEPFETLMKV